MFNVITEAQKFEIEELGKDHWDALVAYGGDMYRKGIFTGAVCALAGYLGCRAIETCVKVVKKHNETKTQ